MVTHILSNLPKEYQIIVEIIEDKLDDEENLLTIDRICENIPVKFDRMNKQSRPITSREEENPSM